MYLACCVISIFLICLRRLAPYLVPYLPTTPTYTQRSHTAATTDSKGQCGALQVEEGGGGQRRQGR